MNNSEQLPISSEIRQKENNRKMRFSNSNTFTLASPKYARAKTASRHFEIARSTLWLWAKTRPGFPQPLKAGKKVTLFDLNAIESYLKSQSKHGDVNGYSD